MKIIRPLLLLIVAASIAVSMGMSKAEYAKKEETLHLLPPTREVQGAY